MPDKTQVTTIELPEELYKAIKKLAIDEDTTFRDLVQRALEQFLARRKGK